MYQNIHSFHTLHYCSGGGGVRQNQAGHNFTATAAPPSRQKNFTATAAVCGNPLLDIK